MFSFFIHLYKIKPVLSNFIKCHPIWFISTTLAAITTTSSLAKRWPMQDLGFTCQSLIVFFFPNSRWKYGNKNISSVLFQPGTGEDSLLIGLEEQVPQKWGASFPKAPWSPSKGEKSKRVGGVVERVASQPPLGNELVGLIEVVAVVGDHHACAHHLRPAWDLVASKHHLHLQSLQSTSFTSVCCHNIFAKYLQNYLQKLLQNIC